MSRYAVIGRYQKFPIRVYTDRQGQHQPLGGARSFIFAFAPGKAGCFYLNVHVTEDLAQDLLSRGDWMEVDFLRLAATAAGAWLREEIGPADPHFNGRDTLLLDQTWYPKGPNDEPLLAANGYYFSVEVPQAEPTEVPWWLEEKKESGSNADEQAIDE